MPHDEFHCEKCEKEVTVTVSIAERERRLQVPGAVRQGAQAAHGHVLFPDIEESLRRHQ
jgi:hypothetical protein